jgi:hypothetical protein
MQDSLSSNRNNQFKHFYAGNLNFQTYVLALDLLLDAWACTVQRYFASEYDDTRGHTFGDLR